MTIKMGESAHRIIWDFATEIDPPPPDLISPAAFSVLVVNVHKPLEDLTRATIGMMNRHEVS